MRILLTNDDGIYAKGIEVLHKHLCTDHEVLVVAPETEQSAVGHAITLTDPLRVNQSIATVSFLAMLSKELLRTALNWPSMS